ncbi:hypothetical protein WJX72_012182 [[Myrmecia] bisecta]|uniref:Uncharacterized protein n=1 Tax=[Myrmecia] bisecta TaxID=41462 RepID=A0AAW1PCS3_9CHLO
MRKRLVDLRTAADSAEKRGREVEILDLVEQEVKLAELREAADNAEKRAAEVEVEVKYTVEQVVRKQDAVDKKARELIEAKMNMEKAAQVSTLPR